MSRLPLPDGSILHADQSVIQVWTEGGLIPDERWRFTDLAGHEHYYDNGYPTLHASYDEDHWCELCRGEYDPLDGYTCLRCGESVEPGTRNEPPRLLNIAGPAHLYLSDILLTPDEAQEALARGEPVRWDYGPEGIRHILEYKALTPAEAQEILRGLTAQGLISEH